MKTIPELLLKQATNQPAAPAYYQKRSGTWHMTTWSQYAAQIKSAGRALISLGVTPNQTVAILGFNRPEWTIFDVAAMAIGAVPAGIYTTCSSEEIKYIVGHAEPSVLLLEKEEHFRRVEKVWKELPTLKHIVMMPGAPAIDHEQVMSWEQFIEGAQKTEEKLFHERLSDLDPQALATLIYTSGTTGPPKGVMLSHDNLRWTAELSVKKLVLMTPNDYSLSYLPLSHIAEQIFTIHGPAVVGSAVYYAESPEKIAENLREVQPTILFGVPRIWEKFHSGLVAKLAAATGLKKGLVEWTMGVCHERHQALNQQRTPTLLNQGQYFLANKILLSKLKPALGLGKARICVSGAAPISTEILEYFSKLDIVIHEVYGQSEGSGPTTFNLPGQTRYGSVGSALPGIQVKIAEDDEILVKGPNVFMGYYKDQAATEATLSDGWLYSGDLGQFNKEGFLYITGRKKDIIITAGGKNIAPKNIEAALKNSPLISEAIVIGDRRKYLTALIAVDEESREKIDDSALHTQVQDYLEKVNKTLAQVETIKKFKILERNLTVENGELTPTFKVKRNKVAEHFASEIESMY